MLVGSDAAPATANAPAPSLLLALPDVLVVEVLKHLLCQREYRAVCRTASVCTALRDAVNAAWAESMVSALRGVPWHGLVPVFVKFSRCREVDRVRAAQYGRVIVERFTETDAEVRRAAVMALGTLEPAALAEHAEAIIGRLCDDGGYGAHSVRQAAVEALGRLEHAALAAHADAIVQLFGYAGPAYQGGAGVAFLAYQAGASTRVAALKTLSKLVPSALANYANAVIGRLSDEADSVREAAVMVLGTLMPTALTAHADAIIQLLGSPDEGTRESALRALGKLEATALEAHAETIVALLNDDGYVRCVI